MYVYVITWWRRYSGWLALFSINGNMKQYAPSQPKFFVDVCRTNVTLSEIAVHRWQHLIPQNCQMSSHPPFSCTSRNSTTGIRVFLARTRQCTFLKSNFEKRGNRNRKTPSITVSCPITNVNTTRANCHAYYEHTCGLRPTAHDRKLHPPI